MSFLYCVNLIGTPKDNTNTALCGCATDVPSPKGNANARGSFVHIFPAHQSKRCHDFGVCLHQCVVSH